MRTRSEEEGETNEDNAPWLLVPLPEGWSAQGGGNGGFCVDSMEDVCDITGISWCCSE